MYPASSGSISLYSLDNVASNFADAVDGSDFWWVGDLIVEEVEFAGEIFASMWEALLDNALGEDTPDDEGVDRDANVDAGVDVVGEWDGEL